MVAARPRPRGKDASTESGGQLPRTARCDVPQAVATIQLPGARGNLQRKRHLGNGDSVDVMENEHRTAIELDGFQRFEREVSILAAYQRVVGARGVGRDIGLRANHLDPVPSEPPMRAGHAVGKRKQPGPQGTRLVAFFEALVHAQEDFVGEVFEVVGSNAEMPKAVPHVTEVFLKDSLEVRAGDGSSGLHRRYLS